MHPREILKAWLPVVVWMALMFFGSTDLMSSEHTSRFLIPFLRWLNPDMSVATLNQVQFLVRKAAHVTEYAILAGLLFRALRGHITGFWWRAAAALLPALVFSLSDEYHQTFVASRTGSIYDVLLDSCGAIVGILICRGIHFAFSRNAAGEGNGPERI
ncbi:MAG: VanZ family protein [Chthoniobacterales bacterium]|nr:VanZ family protein [Chthoniobacterales bacterium]